MTTTQDLQAGQFIDAHGIATHFHQAGSGQPVLFLHGSGPGVSGWANWRHALPTLAESMHVLAPDIVGFGHTERPPTIRYSLRSWTDHIWAFLDALGLERVSVVGNSLGGRIAMQMSEDAPDRIDRLVFMGAPGVGMTLTEGLKALRAYEPSPEAMEALLKTYFAVDESLITDDLIRIRYEASAAPGAHEAYRKMFFDPEHRGASSVSLKSRYERSEHTLCWSMVVRTRSFRSRSPTGWSICCPMPTSTSSRVAATGPRSSDRLISTGS